MIDPGILDYRLLTDAELAAIVQQLRREKGWTQETLAELARVSVRTVQRLEDGQSSSVDTRRALAGVFEFGDIDIFGKPWPLPNLEKLKEEAARIERETIAVNVERIGKGRQLRELAEGSESYLITSLDNPADEVELLMASLQEYFTDYGDCHDLYSATDKLEVNRHFQEKIDELDRLGVGLAGGRRRAQLRFNGKPADHPGMTLDVAYVVSGPQDGLPHSIRVPRQARFGF